MEESRNSRFLFSSLSDPRCIILFYLGKLRNGIIIVSIFRTKFTRIQLTRRVMDDLIQFQSFRFSLLQDRAWWIALAAVGPWAPPTRPSRLKEMTDALLALQLPCAATVTTWSQANSHNKDKMKQITMLMPLQSRLLPSYNCFVLFCLYNFPRVSCYCLLEVGSHRILISGNAGWTPCSYG